MCSVDHVVYMGAPNWWDWAEGAYQSSVGWKFEKSWTIWKVGKFETSWKIGEKKSWKYWIKNGKLFDVE